LFEKGLWQQRKQPFFLSFMSVEKEKSERLSELRAFVKLFKQHLPQFRAKVGLQINYSCPNVGLNIAKLIDEAKTGLKIAAELGIPIMPKFNVLAPVDAVKQITDEKDCDAICVSNTIPWWQFEERIDWDKLFGTGFSPLMEFGNGGLSGWPLLELVKEWVISARVAGITKPINAGGGILRPKDVDVLCEAGASSVFIGSMASLRPWRVQRTIKRANKLFSPA